MPQKALPEADEHRAANGAVAGVIITEF